VKAAQLGRPFTCSNCRSSLRERFSIGLLQGNFPERAPTQKIDGSRVSRAGNARKTKIALSLECMQSCRTGMHLGRNYLLWSLLAATIPGSTEMHPAGGVEVGASVRRWGAERHGDSRYRRDMIVFRHLGPVLTLRGGGSGSESTIDSCLNPCLVGFLTFILSPRMMWRAERHVPYMPDDHGDVLWGTEDMEAHDSFDTLTAGLNQRIGSLPTPTIEHNAIKRRRQLGVGGFAVVFEADIPGKGKASGGWSRTCACKVFSFIAGMGERQTNFFKNWLHELKVLDYLSARPDCGVVDFYGFSLRHEEAEAKIVVQVCSGPECIECMVFGKLGCGYCGYMNIHIYIHIYIFLLGSVGLCCEKC